MMAPLLASSPGWMSRGACHDQDPELFFPIADTGPALQQISAAKAVCGRCAARAICLSYALRSAQYGIWGGTTPQERRAMRQPSGWAAAASGSPRSAQPRAATAAAATRT
jgi:WhiB family transcriptional regulator, redox-sensing transcriptional regulator